MAGMSGAPRRRAGAPPRDRRIAGARRVLIGVALAFLALFLLLPLVAVFAEALRAGHRRRSSTRSSSPTRSPRSG